MVGFNCFRMVFFMISGCFSYFWIHLDISLVISRGPSGHLSRDPSGHLSGDPSGGSPWLPGAVERDSEVRLHFCCKAAGFLQKFL